MANESAVENISDLRTTVTCPGCGQELNLLSEHLRVTISPVRQVIEIVDAALVGAETDESGNITKLAVDVTDTAGGSRDRFYVGTRAGAGDVLEVHNYSCLADVASERAASSTFQNGETVVVGVLDTDPQAETRGND